MPAKRKKPVTPGASSRRNEFDDTEAVSALLKALKHPLQPLIESIRSAVLAADASITEGIKWNTPSFYCQGWFATIRTRIKEGIQLILHHGPKVRADTTLSETISDSSQLLTWLAKDRATITFMDAKDFQGKQAAFKKIIKQWVKYQVKLSKEAHQKA